MRKIAFGWTVAPNEWLCTHGSHGDDNVAAEYADRDLRGACPAHAVEMGAIDSVTLRERALAESLRDLLSIVESTTNEHPGLTKARALLAELESEGLDTDSGPR